MFIEQTSKYQSNVNDISGKISPWLSQDFITFTYWKQVQRSQKMTDPNDMSQLCFDVIWNNKKTKSNTSQVKYQTSITLIRHLPPLFHLPLVLAWQVSWGQPESSTRKKTSSNAGRDPDFALGNMSKSCRRTESLSHGCEAPFRQGGGGEGSGAAVAHGNPPRVGCCHRQSRWCQPRVSRPTMLRFCDALVGWLLEGGGRGVCFASFLFFSLSPPSFSLSLSDTGAPSVATSFPSVKLCLAGARGNHEREHTDCHATATAQLRSARCIGTRFHSGTHAARAHIHIHTHIPLLSTSLSLSLSHSQCCHRCWCQCCCGAAEMFSALLTH